MVQLPSQVISVRGDTTAKLHNEQPAYVRVSIMRAVEFACQRCGQDMHELRYPGPLPRYCPSCRAINEQTRNEERVRRQQMRRKLAAAQRKEHGVPAQKGERVEREQISSPRRAEEEEPEPRWSHLLPETTRLLNRIERTSGEEQASSVAAAIAAELEHQRLMLTEARISLVIDVMEQGSQIGYADLPDVDLPAGIDAYCAFCTHASLEDLQAARDNARCIVEAPARRRRLTQLANEQQERS